MKKYYKLTIAALSIAAFITFPLSALAGKAVLNWNANTESDLAGYKIYYGLTPRTGNHPAGGYTNGPIDVGNVLSYNTNPLEMDQKYYFSVVAVDTSGNVSDFSTEVSKTILGGDIIKDEYNKVDISDYAEFIKYFGSNDCNNYANIVGLVSPCEVNIDDYAVLIKDFGKSNSNP
jgi:hypothetical protein